MTSLNVAMFCGEFPNIIRPYQSVMGSFFWVKSINHAAELSTLSNVYKPT